MKLILSLTFISMHCLMFAQNIEVASTIGKEFNFLYNDRLLEYAATSDTMIVVKRDTFNLVDDLGLKQGPWRVRYHNGRYWQATFEDDSLQNDFQLFDAHDELILSGVYKDGVKYGLWKWDVIFAGQDSVVYSEGLELGSHQFNWSDSKFEVGLTRHILPYGYSFFLQKWQHHRLEEITLNDLLMFLLNHPNISIEIIGNTGIEQANNPMYSQVNSLALPKSICDYLEHHGIENSRLSHKTNEDSKFMFLIPSDHNEWVMNQRITVRISDIN